MVKIFNHLVKISPVYSTDGQISGLSIDQWLNNSVYVTLTLIIRVAGGGNRLDHWFLHYLFYFSP